MPRIENLTLVTVENIHEVIPAFIIERQLLISTYEDMVDVVMDMIKSKHVFNMDRDLLRTIMEDLTYMYSPGDDINKERVMEQLVESDEEEDEEDEDMPPQVQIDNLLPSDLED